MKAQWIPCRLTAPLVQRIVGQVVLVHRPLLPWMADDRAAVTFMRSELQCRKGIVIALRRHVNPPPVRVRIRNAEKYQLAHIMAVRFRGVAVGVMVAFNTFSFFFYLYIKILYLIVKASANNY